MSSTQFYHGKHNQTHFRSLFYWIFVPLLQHELNEFQKWWNGHRVRRQPAKLMPSGHVPSFALDYPAEFQGTDCRIEVPKEAVGRLREFLEEDTISREECFQWYSNEFADVASAAWNTLGCPIICLASAWDVFAQMAPLVTSP